MKEQGDNKKEQGDIFEQASSDVVKRTITLTEERPITEQNLPVRTDFKTRSTFAQLKKAVDLEHAERFNNILHTLPDREFVRVYLKTLEFFKPKVIRQIGDGSTKKDTNITITIKR